MKIPTYERQSVKPQNYNTVFEQPDLSKAQGMAVFAGVAETVEAGLLDLYKQKKEALKEIEWGKIENEVEEQVSGLVEESQDFLKQQTDFRSTQGAAEFYKTKQQALFSTYMETIKDPQMKQGAQEYWKAISGEGEKVIYKLGTVRTDELAAAELGKALATAEHKGDKEKIREIILTQEKYGLIRPGDVTSEYEASHYRMHLNSTWGQLSQLSYEDGLMALSGSELDWMSKEDRKAFTKRHTEIWGLRNKARKEERDERSIRVESKYLQMRHNGTLTSDLIMSDPESSDLLGVREHFSDMLEADEKAGLSGTQSPNDMNNIITEAKITMKINDPALSDNDRSKIVLDNTGSQGMSVAAGKVLLKGIAKGDYNEGFSQAVKRVSGTFQGMRSGKSENDKSELRAEESKILLELQHRIKPDMTGDDITKLTDNLLSPTIIKGFKNETLKMGGFFDSRVRSDLEDLQWEIQQGSFYGVVEGNESLEYLREVQFKYLKDKIEEITKESPAFIDDYGQFVTKGKNGYKYKIVIVGKDEVIKVDKGYGWEFIEPPPPIKTHSYPYKGNQVGN